MPEDEKVYRKSRNVLIWEKGDRRIEITNEYGPNDDMAVYISGIKKRSVYKSVITHEEIEHLKRLILEQKPFKEIPVIFA